MSAPLARLALAAAIALADALPQRKPGLWKSKSIGAEGEMVAKQCA